jgi:dsDNA-specific endonuclease/ATPase MutS2
VDEATAREARRLLEKAIDETAGETAGEKAREGWMSLEELKRARRGSASPNLPKPPPTSSAPSLTAATEISLIGLRVAEAEPLLVKALDDAVLADLPYLRVVHGKGTGALREFVHDVLSADPRVKRFGFAPPNQGGHGVTLVEFRA